MLNSVVAIATFFAIATAEDYCEICSDHTMCRFGENTMGRGCGRKTEGGISRAEIEEILRVHNEYRSTVAQGIEPRGSPGPQPFAADMYALVWDDKLAEVAQRWADQCIFQHDRCRDDPRFPVGQNIYLNSGSTRVSWSRAIQTWYDEVSQMDPRNVSSYRFDFNSGHYAQLMWAKTRYVGCGKRSYGGSYRPRGSPAVEYVLSEVRGKNIIEEEEPESLQMVESHNFTEDTVLKRIMRKIPNLDTPEIMKKSSERKPTASRSVIDNISGQTSSKQIIHYNQSKYQYPTSISSYPGFSSYYPYGQYLSFKPEELQEVLEDSSESLESRSSEDISDERRLESRAINNKGNQQVPISLQLSSWSNEGWMTQNYDMVKDRIFICNYGPAGNFFGEPLYESGEPCSKCPDNTTCKDGLCT